MSQDGGVISNISTGTKSRSKPSHILHSPKLKGDSFFNLIVFNRERYMGYVQTPMQLQKPFEHSQSFLFAGHSKGGVS